jgi:uncharacterized membrane protein YesL
MPVNWINFIISNYKQILLLLVVMVIVYWVEYLAHFNTLLYGMLAMPSIPGVTNTSQFPTNKKKKKTTK